MRIAAIVPTYNEAENLPRMVSALLALPLDLMVVIVDDNSPDGTGQIADKLSNENPGKMKVIHRPGKFGLSAAYLHAFRSLFDSEVDVLAQLDCDFSHDPAELVEMAKCIENCDVVFGSRYVSGGGTDEHWPLWRKGLSAWGNFYSRTILGLKIRDVTGGYRMWRKEVLKSLPLERVKSSGYIFTVEMAYLTYCFGYRIMEIPIYFADRRWGKSKMSFKIQSEAALRVWSVLWNYRDLRAKMKRGRKS